MYPYIGDFPTGQTIFFPFHTFNSSGASVTLTGLAITDIEVYRGASMTQRSSDSGYALVDTDGIDLDGITGIHGFTIDTSDNTDAGFFAAGYDYTVVVSSVTIDSQTVNFIAGRFSIANRTVGALSTQAKADINAEVLDVLNTDTFAEPGQESPGATVSLVKKIGYLYKAWRNKSTQTTTTYNLYADDGSTIDQKTTVSDDGATATRGEMATGP